MLGHLSHPFPCQQPLNVNKVPSTPNIDVDIQQSLPPPLEYHTRPPRNRCQVARSSERRDSNCDTKKVNRGGTITSDKHPGLKSFISVQDTTRQKSVHSSIHNMGKQSQARLISKCSVYSANVRD